MKQNFLIFLDFTKKLLFRDRSVIKTMVVRDLRAQYVGSLFGVLWAVIEPLSQVLIYGLVFGFQPSLIRNTAR
jgi:ABC-type polysaccharide/polyol phosphate export permease